MVLADKLKDPTATFFDVLLEAKKAGKSMDEARQEAVAAFVEKLKEAKEEAMDSLAGGMPKLELSADAAKKAIGDAFASGKEQALQAMRDTMNDEVLGVLEGLVEEAGIMAVEVVLEKAPMLKALGQERLEEKVNGLLLEKIMPTLEDKVGAIVAKFLGEGEEEEEEEGGEGEEEEEEEGGMASVYASMASVKEATVAKVEPKKDLVTFTDNGDVKTEKVPDTSFKQGSREDKTSAAAGLNLKPIGAEELVVKQGEAQL
jgi:hypothetical protein